MKSTCIQQGPKRIFKSGKEGGKSTLSTEGGPRVSPDASVLQFAISRRPENTFLGYSERIQDKNRIIFKNLSCLVFAIKISASRYEVSFRKYALSDKILDQHFENIFQRLSFPFGF